MKYDELRLATNKAIAHRHHRAAGGSGQAAGELSQMSREVVTPVQETITLWAKAAAIVQEPYSEGPTRQETAVAAALGLHAYHQKGTPRQANNTDLTSFGAAMHRVGDKSKKAASRAMQGIVSSGDFESLRWQLRAAVSILRANNLSANYGQLAVELNKWLNPDQRREVQARWARDFETPYTNPKTRTSEHDPKEAK